MCLDSAEKGIKSERVVQMMKFLHKRKINFLLAAWVLIASLCAPYQAMAGLETEKFYKDC